MMEVAQHERESALEKVKPRLRGTFHFFGFFAALFGRKHGQRRAAFGQRAVTGREIETVAMIIAADLRAITNIEQLPSLFQIRVFMGALARECIIFSLDERQEHLASAEVDFFHGTRIEFTDADVQQHITEIFWPTAKCLTLTRST